MITQSLAYRFGSGIGLVASALLHAKRPALRWAKRSVVAGVLMWAFIANVSWIVSSLLTIGCIGLIMVALVKGDADLSTTSSLFSETYDAPYGRDSVGFPLDSWGDSTD